MSPKTISKWQIILIWGMSLTYNLKGKGICTVIINNRTFYLKIQELTVSQVKFFSVWGKLSMKCEGILMFHMGQKLFSFSQDTKVRGEKYNKFYQECVSLWYKHLRQLCFLLSDSWAVTLEHFCQRSLYHPLIYLPTLLSYELYRAVSSQKSPQTLQWQRLPTCLYRLIVELPRNNTV